MCHGMFLHIHRFNIHVLDPNPDLYLSIQIQTRLLLYKSRSTDPQLYVFTSTMPGVDVSSLSCCCSQLSLSLQWKVVVVVLLMLRLSSVHDQCHGSTPFLSHLQSFTRFVSSPKFLPMKLITGKQQKLEREILPHSHWSSCRIYVFLIGQCPISPAEAVKNC